EATLKAAVGGRGVSEIKAAERGSGSEELNTDALTTIIGLTKIDHSAFQLFLRFRVGEDQHFAVVDFVLEHKQPAVGVDDDGLADFLEFFSVVATTGGLHAHLVEYAGAASRRLVKYFRHEDMFGRRVEEGQFASEKAFPESYLYEGTGLAQPLTAMRDQG